MVLSEIMVNDVVINFLSNDRIPVSSEILLTIDKKHIDNVSLVGIRF